MLKALSGKAIMYKINSFKKTVMLNNLHLINT